VRAISGYGPLVHVESIVVNDGEMTAKVSLEFGERRHAPAIPLHCYDVGSRVEQRASKPAGARTDFIDSLSLERSGNRGDPRKKLPIENEVLTESLAGLEPVTGDDVT
jgi:hypothetical protein